MTNTTPPTDTRPVLVIGATGKTGRRVVEGLQAAGQAVRSASRSSSTRFDWDDSSTWGPALAGARASYIVPPEVPVDMALFVRLAEEAGVERFVMLSARQPDQGGDGMMPAVEAALRAGSIPVTVLQPAWFVQNFTEGMFVPELADGVLHLPVGDGLEPFVDVADIADVAVAALTEDGHAGKTYELAGPELMTFAQAVERVGAATGRDLRLETIEAEAWSAVAADHLPPPVVSLLINLFAGIRDGDNAHLSHGVREALGRPPRAFTEALA